VEILLDSMVAVRCLVNPKTKMHKTVLKSANVSSFFSTNNSVICDYCL
jgi:hypothetical protein